MCNVTYQNFFLLSLFGLTVRTHTFFSMVTLMMLAITEESWTPGTEAGESPELTLALNKSWELGSTTIFQ